MDELQIRRQAAARRALPDCPACHAPAGWPCVSLEYAWTPLLPHVKTHKARTSEGAGSPRSGSEDIPTVGHSPL